VLVEGQITNLLLQSQAFDATAAWTPQATTVSPNTHTAPDGTMTGDTLVNSTAGVSLVYQPLGAASATYTFSVYVRSLSGTMAFRLGAYVTPPAANIYSSEFTATAEWQRFTFTVTGSIGHVIVAGGAASTGSIVVWGAQLEQGSSPSSHIPTTTAQVTRAGDNISLPTASMPFDATKGTLFVEAGSYRSWGENGINTLASLEGVSNQESYRFSANTYGYGPYFYVYDDGVQQASLGSGVLVATGGLPIKLAGAWALNDIAAVWNFDETVRVDSSATLPTVTTLHIGKDALASTSLMLNGHIKQLTYLPRRATNAELIAMTE
jgi:hypothetical protein